MTKHTIQYKDKLGRKSQCELFGKDEYDVRDKFNTLYAECVIVDIVKYF